MVLRGAMVVVALAALATVAAASTAVRGVPPPLLDVYSGPTFRCLDGSAEVAADQVNDDYCDCADGSDEPGTSACPHGQFYCANAGFRPRLLHSSRVNDGVCDCCDGSDEYSLVVQCANTCEEDGRDAREAARLVHDLQHKGYAVKLDYIQEGDRLREEHATGVSALEEAVASLNEEMDRLDAAKREAEEPEREAKARFDVQWEETVKERVERAKRSLFELLDVDKSGTLSEEELKAHKAMDKNGDGAVDEDEAHQRTDADGNGVADAKDAAHDYESFCSEIYEELAPLFVEAGEHEKPPEKGDKPDYDEEIQALIAKAEEARAAHRVVQRSHKEKVAELEKVRKKLQLDVGEQLEFVKLLDQCFEVVDRDYKYKLCMFEKVTQEPKDGGRQTNLGTWSKWAGPEGDKYAVMKYENGEKCWNGPNRSMTVKVECGAENELSNVAEPNRCEYTMTLKTPAKCAKPPPEPHDPLRHEEL